MGLTTSGRTWDDAASPAALRLARRFEDAWRAAGDDPSRSGLAPRLDPFLKEAETDDCPGARLALLRAEMCLRWESGDQARVAEYLERFPGLSGETLVALVYEEFCLREEAGEAPDPVEYLGGYPAISGALRRVLDIHGLVGSGTTTSYQSSTAPTPCPYPKAGETTAGFRLVEELGRGAFARVFLAEERQLADRPVALKVARVGSREPQTLARLQHTHIVPVYSYRTDPATGLHLLCMPYFGRVTLARLLADPKVRLARAGADLVEALDRLEPGGPGSAGAAGSTARKALARRSYAQALAWWGARMAEALGHAHDRGVLHRDVKPSNVLVTRDGLPMLLDFNLARENVPGDDDPGLPGGTLDYMSPEQIDELAEGVSAAVGPWSDVFGLGVVLYEALAGKRPFDTPRTGLTASEFLTRASASRRQGPPPLRDARPDVPAVLVAVVRRCLEPSPGDRYRSAADLAFDLQAVAEDRPIRFAREPLAARVFRWTRRNRRVLATVAPALLAVGVISALLVRVQLNQARLRADVQSFYQKGNEYESRGDFEGAMVQFEAAARLAEEPDRLLKSLKLAAVRPPAAPSSRVSGQSSLKDVYGESRRRYRDAQRTVIVRQAARKLSEAADPLRFRLTGFGGDLGAASSELVEILKPFYVLTDEAWLKRPDLARLDAGALGRLQREVNELLFLWALAFDRAAERYEKNHDNAMARQARTRGLDVCDRALFFATPADPWRALRARFSRGLDGVTPEPNAPAIEEGGSEPLGWFQWGALLTRQGRRAEGIGWFRKAARKEAENYWFQFYVAFAYDEPSTSSNPAEALRHYDVAVALEPRSPWVRFCRGRLYRTRGVWSYAFDDFREAMASYHNLPEAGRDAAFERQVKLELGVLRQSLGDLAGARAEYDAVIRSDPAGDYARAARLNLAKIDADSGEIARAQATYDTLVTERPGDHDIRLARAMLALRQGRPASADSDLTALLDDDPNSPARGDVLAVRALARLALGRPADALRDAEVGHATRHGPRLERARTRALIALARTAELNLTRPEDFEALPLNGRPLQDDLRRLVERLASPSANPPGSPNSVALQAVLNRAVAQSVLGAHALALGEAERATRLAPLSGRVYLVRARVHRRAGNADAAWADVERARSIEPDDPRVWELRGRLRTEAGDPAGGLADLDHAIELGQEGSIRGLRAEAFMALGNPQFALADWSMALNHDPDDPRAYLGRARAFVRVRQWDQALADLEQAAGWSEGRPGLGLRVAFEYARCLPQRPRQFPRLISLVRRLLVTTARTADARAI